MCPQESGLSAWIGGQLHPLEHVPPLLAVMLITVVIAFFTEFASNTATIIIFLPVLAELVRIPVARLPTPSPLLRGLPGDSCLLPECTGGFEPQSQLTNDRSFFLKEIPKKWGRSFAGELTHEDILVFLRKRKNLDYMEILDSPNQHRRLSSHSSVASVLVQNFSARRIPLHMVGCQRTLIFYPLEAGSTL